MLCIALQWRYPSSKTGRPDHCQQNWLHLYGYLHCSARADSFFVWDFVHRTDTDAFTAAQRKMVFFVLFWILYTAPIRIHSLQRKSRWFFLWFCTPHRYGYLYCSARTDGFFFWILYTAPIRIPLLQRSARADGFFFCFWFCTLHLHCSARQEFPCLYQLEC